MICGLADKGLDLLFLAVVAVVLARPLDDWLGHASPWLAHNWSLRLVALFLAVTALHLCVSLPLSFYAGYVLEHRFHLSTLSVGGWLWRMSKRNLLAIAPGHGHGPGPVLADLDRRTGWWWLTAAAVFFLVSVLLGQLLPRS